MKAYYIGGAIAAVALFFVLWAITAMASCSQSNGIKNKYLEHEVENTVELRYFADDDYNGAEIYFMRVYDASDYSITKIPTKTGYNFVGLFDSPDPYTRVLYVGTDGRGLVTLSGNTLLYPVFERIGGQ